ncbi:MAG: nucleotidyltransferase [Verrucomicrobia bacterium]|nr:MAG: nucleotidyltransferase [Verrucomicrobiota bacterium]
MTDLRWKQRFSNYRKALQQLKAAVELATERPLSDLEKQGMIQAFEFTHELAWKVIKDFYEHQGETDIQGSRDATRLAFQRGLLEKGDVWMGMIKDRNRSSHTYDEATALSLTQTIQNSYFDAFLQLEKSLTAKRDAD